MIRKVCLAIFLVLSIQVAHAQDEESRWVDSVYNQLSTDQRIGQLFIMPIYPTANEEHLISIRNIIDKYGLGGVQLMAGTPGVTDKILHDLEKNAPVGLLSFMNASQGIASTLTTLPSQFNLLSLSAVQDKALVNMSGFILQNQLDQIDVDYGIIYTDYVYINNKIGLGRQGLDTFSELVKNSHQDYSHLTLAGFPAIKEKISKPEFIKFISSKRHIFNELPAVFLDESIISFDKGNQAVFAGSAMKIIRQEGQFKGLFIASGISQSKKYQPGKTETAAITVGNNMVVSSDIATSIKHIKILVKKSNLNESVLEYKVKRVLQEKYRQRRIEHIPYNITPVDEIKFLIHKNKVRDASITVLDDENHLPIVQLDDKQFASLSNIESQEFRNALDDFTTFSHYDFTNAVDRLEKVLPLYDYVVIGIFGDIDDQIINMINDLPAQKVIFCAAVDHPSILKIKLNAPWILGYEKERDLKYLLPNHLFGAKPSGGKLPLQLSSTLTEGKGESKSDLGRLTFGSPDEVGMNEKVLYKIDDIVKEAVTSKATPGGQVIIARRGKIIYENNFGHYTYDSVTPVDRQTVYDIASITKVAATTQAMMLLYEHGVIDLDKRIARYLQELEHTNKADMTIRDILSHQAGLWPYLPFWKETIDGKTYASLYYRFSPDDDYPYQISDGLYSSSITQDSVWQWVKQSKLRNKENRVPYGYRYSDMGYYILKRIIESKINQPMEEFLQQHFYDPLGLGTLSYLPLCKYSKNCIAPTEYDNYFRKTLVKGMVHDQGAAMLGGVAGHAGLFSNAIDLAKLMQMNLQGGKYGGVKYLEKMTLHEFTGIQYKNNRRGLGWDKPVVGEWNSPTSVYTSPKAFGHTGFTGTAVWVDPEFDLIYVFLSNRIYPDAGNKKLIRENIRTRIQDVIYESIWQSIDYQHLNCN